MRTVCGLQSTNSTRFLLMLTHSALILRIKTSHGDLVDRSLTKVNNHMRIIQSHNDTKSSITDYFRYNAFVNEALSTWFTGLCVRLRLVGVDVDDRVLRLDKVGIGLPLFFAIHSTLLILIIILCVTVLTSVRC